MAGLVGQISPAAARLSAKYDSAQPKGVPVIAYAPPVLTENLIRAGLGEKMG